MEEYLKNKNSIYGTLLSLILSYNFKIIYSNDIKESANILEIIYKHGKYYKTNNIHLIKQKKNTQQYLSTIEYYSFNSFYWRKICRKIIEKF
jgi:ERCC4-type nuclease